MPGRFPPVVISLCDSWLQGIADASQTPVKLLIRSNEKGFDPAELLLVTAQLLPLLCRDR
jgi:hypothetical protein